LVAGVKNYMGCMAKTLACRQFVAPKSLDKTALATEKLSDVTTNKISLEW
jgi:hypothetical protein